MNRQQIDAELTMLEINVERLKRWVADLRQRIAAKPVDWRPAIKASIRHECNKRGLPVPQVAQGSDEDTTGVQR